jgi:hypothetical protein
MYLPGWKAKKGDIICSVATLTGKVVKGTEVLVIGTVPRIGIDALLVMEKDGLFGLRWRAYVRVKTNDQSRAGENK